MKVVDSAKEKVYQAKLAIAKKLDAVDYKLGKKLDEMDIKKENKERAKKEAIDNESIEKITKILNEIIDADAEQQIKNGNKEIKRPPRFNDFRDTNGSWVTYDYVYDHSADEKSYVNPKDNLMLKLCAEFPKEKLRRGGQLTRVEEVMAKADKNIEASGIPQGICEIIHCAYMFTCLTDAKIAKIILDQGVKNICDRRKDNYHGGYSEMKVLLGLSAKEEIERSRNAYDDLMRSEAVMTKKYPNDIIRFSDNFLSPHESSKFSKEVSPECAVFVVKHEADVEVEQGSEMPRK